MEYIEILSLLYIRYKSSFNTSFAKSVLIPKYNKYTEVKTIPEIDNIKKLIKLIKINNKENQTHFIE